MSDPKETFRFGRTCSWITLVAGKRQDQKSIICSVSHERLRACARKLKLWEGFTLLKTVRQDSSNASPFPKRVCSGAVIFGASHRSVRRAVSCCVLRLWESLTSTQDTPAGNERIPRLWPCRIFARNMTRIFRRLRLPRLAKDLLWLSSECWFVLVFTPVRIPHLYMYRPKEWPMELY